MTVMPPAPPRDRVAGLRRTARGWQVLWWPGIRPLVISAAVCALLLLVYALLAEEIVADGRQRTDDRISLLVNDWTGHLRTTVIGTVTHLGDTLTINILYAAMAGWLIGIGRLRAAALTVAAGAGGQALVAIMKDLSGRPRPDVVEPIVVASGYSFPSGHTFGAVIAWGLLAALVAARLPGRWRWVAWAAWALVAAAVGFSRIYLGAHFATDVLGSFALGGAWLIVSLTVLELLENPRRYRPRAFPRLTARARAGH